MSFARLRFLPLDSDIQRNNLPFVFHSVNMSLTLAHVSLGSICHVRLDFLIMLNVMNVHDL